MTDMKETTDLTLFVRTSGDESARWNRQRIVDALLRETGIDYITAETISKEVEKQIITSGITRLTTTLIRELVDARLVEKGMEQARRMHATLGFPMFDVRQLLLHENKENANVPHGPEGTNLILAEGIKREYALHDVFPQDVCDAHISGDLHLHGLGYIDRPYSSLNSLEYLKRFGLDLPHALTVAHPARHAEVLLAHMVRFSAVLQGLFGGLISWDMVNISFAPYISGLSRKEVKQFAQMLVYEFSQLTSTRGGQALFTDIHLHWHIPSHLACLPAIGPGGEFSGKTCGDYQKEARELAWAIFDVFAKGDARGRPFIFPRPLVHITEEFFHSADDEDFLLHLCKVAGDKGNTFFVFDRTGEKVDIPSPEGTGHKAGQDNCWGIKEAVIHNVTINLPRLGYRAKGDERRLFALLDEQLELAASAHLHKRAFIERLLSLGERGPLAVLTMERDGRQYLKLEESRFLVGVVGLNELAEIQSGKGLADDDAGLAFGLRFVRHLRERVDKLSDRTGLPLLLVQTEAETTAYRFARLDLKYFSPEAGNFVRGDIARGGMYYSNSTQLPVSAAVNFLSRVEREGRFHPYLPGGATSILHLGAHSPSPSIIASFIKQVFTETAARRLVFSPEFTTCLSCSATTRGLQSQCPVCLSRSVDGIARITQYFSRTSGWNRGKLAELKDRNRQTPFFPE
ncbi:MAG: anaerobic ribonucleoside-triphosphate reductase [Smithellaceae bacterium]|nr:anaerobic ribonucleoside-triphosphate reductase [Smithellaceae bacterium]